MLEICGTCSQVLLPPRIFSVGGEIRGKEKGPREGNEPAQIYEKASVLEAEHMVSAQKLQAESENHTRSSLEFQDSSATGFFKGYALVVVSPYPP